MIKQATFPQENIPAGFCYPQAYLDLAQNSELLDSSSWWLIGKKPEFAHFCLKVLQSKGGNKVLIPFAKDDQSGDLACFDGADCQGSPRVYFHVGEKTFEGVNWDTRYSQTFEDWLQEALD